MLGTPPEGPVRVFAPLPPPALVFGVQYISGRSAAGESFCPISNCSAGAVIANILMFHIAMQPTGIAPGLVVFALCSGTRRRSVSFRIVGR